MEHRDDLGSGLKRMDGFAGVYRDCQWIFLAPIQGFFNKYCVCIHNIKGRKLVLAQQFMPFPYEYRSEAVRASGLQTAALQARLDLFFKYSGFAEDND